MKQQNAQKILTNLEGYTRRDRVFMNNPVMMQGLGLAPLVVMATSVHNALMLCVAVALLLIPTRLLGSLLFRRLRQPLLRAVAFCVTASALYAGAVYPLMDWAFGTNLLHLGIYLPMLVMEPLIIYRYGTRPEPLGRAFTKSLSVTGGYLLILLLFGALRELLINGSLLGLALLPAGLLPVAAQPAGGLILLGVFCAVWRALTNRRKRTLTMEARQSV